MRLSMLITLCLLSTAALAARHVEMHNGAPPEMHSGQWWVVVKIANETVDRSGPWETLADCELIKPQIAFGAYCVQVMIDKDGHQFVMGSHDPAWTQPH